MDALLRGAGFERQGPEHGSHAVYWKPGHVPVTVPLDCNPLHEMYVSIILDVIAEFLENAHEGSA
jgi:predicted RNA binding protein YcfA (HicA-like mRNA interferase family)